MQKRRSLKSLTETKNDDLIIDDTVGSFFFPLNPMKVRYENYENQEEKYRIRREILRSYVCINLWRKRNRGVKEIIREYVIKRLENYYGELRNITPFQWDREFKALQENGFIDDLGEKINIEPAYIDKIIARHETEQGIANEIISYYPTTETYTKLIWRVSTPNLHKTLFQQLCDRDDVFPDSVTFNCLILRSENFEEALGHFYDMQLREIKFDEHTTLALLKRASSLNEIKMILDIVQQDKLPINIISLNMFISHPNSDSDFAWKVYKLIQDFNLTPVDATFYSLIGKTNTFDAAYEIYQDMQKYDIAPNESFFTSLLYKKGGSFNRAWDIYEIIENKYQNDHYSTNEFNYSANKIIERTKNLSQALKIYQHLLSIGAEMSATIFNSLINKTSNYKEARIIFDEMSNINIKPTINTYNTLLRKVNNDDFNTAWNIYQEISRNQLPPDNVTFFNLIKRSLASENAWKIFHIMKELNIEIDHSVCHILIEKSDRFDLAWEAYNILKKIKKPSWWTCYLLALKSIHFSDGQKVLEEMRKLKIKSKKISKFRYINNILIRKSKNIKEVLWVLDWMKEFGIIINSNTTKYLIKKCEQSTLNEYLLDRIRTETHLTPLTNNRLCVENLHYSVGKKVLKKTFSTCGNVINVAIYMVNKQRNVFIEMSTIKEAEIARQKLNYTKLRGRLLIITQYILNNKKLRIDNLNPSMTEEIILDLFAQYGTLTAVELIQGKGYAFIEMSTIKEAELAWQNLNHSELSGQKLKVSVPTRTSKNEVLRWD